jgi:aldose 1-epimerase
MIFLIVAVCYFKGMRSQSMALETQVESAVWGRTAEGEEVTLFTLRNESMQVKLTTYGARITSVLVADREGVAGEVALGADTLMPYLADTMFIGATIGRLANRLAQGRFVLAGEVFEVPLNNGPNALHGGPEGFDKKVWKAAVVEHGVEMSYLSPDGEMGFPGNLDVRVTITLEGTELGIAYAAVTDKATVVNLTNHAYWNLSGEGGSIAEHSLRLVASRFTPIDATQIPTGEMARVAGTPHDFLCVKTIGQDWDCADAQVQLGRGFDHNWVIDRGEAEDALVMAAEVVEPTSGRTLRVFTTEPGVQFYSGNFLDGSFVGHEGKPCAKRTGFCLETQHFPDAPNHAGFASTRLDAGETFRSKTTYVFGVEEAGF